MKKYILFDLIIGISCLPFIFYMIINRCSWDDEMGKNVLLAIVITHLFIYFGFAYITVNYRFLKQLFYGFLNFVITYSLLGIGYIVEVDFPAIIVLFIYLLIIIINNYLWHIIIKKSQK